MSSVENGKQNVQDLQLKRLPERVEQKLRKLRFQNYTPKSELLKPYCDEEGVDPNLELQEIVDSHDKLIRSTNIKFMDPALDFENLLPKKANVEMKRALTDKLDRLSRRTKLAIVDIARKKQMEDGDLTGPAGAEPNVSSDEEGS